MPDAALKAVVTAHSPEARVLRTVRLSGGVSADVYRIDLEAEDSALQSLVVRVHGPHHNGHPAALEVEILSALTELGLCTPRVMALDESLRFIPYPLVILHHIDGETFCLTLADDCRIGTMAKMLAHIHSVPIAGLPSLPTRIDPIPEIFDFLPQDSEFDRLRVRLSNIPNTRYDGPKALLHGDFWPGNLLWKGEQLVGVLDWEDAAYGDPLSDLACAALELSYVTGPSGAQRFLSAYNRLRPFDLNRLALWQLYVAAAAYHSMGGWGLDPNREAHMRATTLSTIRDAGALIL